MTTPDAFRDAEHFTDVSGIPDVAESVDGDRSSSPDLRRKVQKKAKVAFIDRLLRELDIVIYCELAALYYMDCSFFLFALRVIVQLIFFTPKAPPFDPTRSQPFIGAIFSSNIMCIFLHVIAIHPSADEETRGYLHGGLFIDFVGQKAPVSRIRLVTFDLLVMLVHFVMLGLVVERVQTDAGRQTTQNEEPASADSADSGQDLDAEERGIRRNENTSLASPRSRDSSLERTVLLAEPAEDGLSLMSVHPLDAFASGGALIIDMGLLDTIRDQWRYNTASRPRTSFTPSQETTTFLRERLGVSMGPDGRVLGFRR